MDKVEIKMLYKVVFLPLCQLFSFSNHLTVLLHSYYPHSSI